MSEDSATFAHDLILHNLNGNEEKDELNGPPLSYLFSQIQPDEQGDRLGQCFSTGGTGSGTGTFRPFEWDIKFVLKYLILRKIYKY